MTPPIVALTNQKGGVGKTTVTLNLAAAAADRGIRVLAVDLDPQGNLTTGLDLPADPEYTTYDVLYNPVEGGAVHAITQTSWPKVDALPADRNLARIERDSQTGIETRLRRGLAGATDFYDLVLCDCPPSLGVLSVNALVAADAALLVTEAGAASIAGLAEVLTTIDTVNETYAGAHCRPIGIVVNRWEDTLEQRGRRDELVGYWSDAVWEPVVPKSTVLAAAYGARVPVSRMPGARAAALTAVFGALLERLLAAVSAA